MEIERRIRTCQFLEKMGTDREYSRKLGVTNASTFHGVAVENRNNTRKADGNYHTIE